MKNAISSTLNMLSEVFRLWLVVVPVAVTRHQDVMRVRLFGVMVARIELK